MVCPLQVTCHLFDALNSVGELESQNAKPVHVRFVVELNLRKTTVIKNKIVPFINLCSPQSHDEGLLKIS